MFKILSTYLVQLQPAYVHLSQSNYPNAIFELVYFALVLQANEFC